MPIAAKPEDRVDLWFRLGRWGHDLVVASSIAAALLILAAVVRTLTPGTWSNKRFGYPGSLWPSLVLAIALLAGVVFGLRWLARRELAPRTWLLGGAIGLAAFGSKLAPALVIKSVPISDFLVQLDAAKGIAAGDWSFNGLEYFQVWGYQTGFSLYQAVVLKATGPSLTGLLVMGAVFMAATNVLVFVLAFRLTSNRWVALAAAVAYLFYPGPYTLASVLTGQHLSTCLVYFGLYLAIKALQDATGWFRLWWAAAAGLALALGDMIRPISVVAVVAVVVTFAGAWLVHRLGWRAAIAISVTLLAAYLGTLRGADFVARQSGLIPTGLGNNFPEWKLLNGLDREAGGQSSRMVFDAFRIGEWSYLVDHDAARSMIRQELHDIRHNLPSFVNRKTTALWAQQEKMIFAFKPYLEAGPPYSLKWQERLDRIALVERGHFIVVITLAGAAGIVTWRKRPVDSPQLLVTAFVSCFFLAHLLVEVQARYRYEAMPAIFALASVSVLWLTSARPSGPFRRRAGPGQAETAQARHARRQQ